MDTLLQWLANFVAWLVDLLLWIPLKLWGLVLGALATLIESIPVPGWAASISFAGLDSTLIYFATPFRLDLALTVIVSASILRFVIRRIPVIG